MNDTPIPQIASAPRSPAVLMSHPEVRNYVVAAAAALVLIFGLMMGKGSTLGGALTAMLGVAGLFLRWQAAPAFVVLLSLYFTLFPTGVPEFRYSDPYGMRRSSFRLEDMLFTASLLVYVASQYRLYGVLVQSVPNEERRRVSTPSNVVRRPPEAIAVREVMPLFMIVGIAVLFGQVSWYLLTALRIDAEGGFALAMSPGGSYYGPSRSGRFSPSASRFVLLAGVIFFLTTLSLILFSIRRYRSLSKLEAEQILQDTQWSENYREFSRLETWRAWASRRSKRGPNP